jgi:hypothetical protein
MPSKPFDVDLDRELGEVMLIAQACGLQFKHGWAPESNDTDEAKHKRLAWTFIHLARFHLDRVRPSAH